MQINGAHLATVFAPKSLELQEQTRKPVTIDATSSFKIEDEASSKVEAESQSIQAAITVNDGQQAQFVRFFATGNEASHPPQGVYSSATPLPQGVQQYIQIASLQSELRQSVVDEIV